MAARFWHSAYHYTKASSLVMEIKTGPCQEICWYEKTEREADSASSRYGISYSTRMCHVSLQFLFPCENSDILLAKFPHMGHQSSIMETTGIYRFQNFPTFTSLAAKTKWMPLEFGGNLLPVMLLLTRLLLWARLRRFFPKEYGSPACSTNLAILETGAQALSS